MILRLLAPAMDSHLQKNRLEMLFVIPAMRLELKNQRSATQTANLGTTISQLKGLFGWISDDMPSLCTKTADQRRLAVEGIDNA
ncbi:hypothetical protein [Bartonella tamiae]|uniref:Uncharacterized protein n=1 Tax=Bartonella tamiae Th239 TaxID=1094558 RepID=J0R5W8_9HYPH|nr:hypothetical protein [Bartonella tamiae]EJF91094.1 hypothetical protein ME5_00426 [Bartonella tamiae Th239]EJF93241.1 hypothetical protein MEG_01455 [Bartonella tamiae Th307]